MTFDTPPLADGHAPASPPLPDTPQESGVAAPSYTVLGGRYCIRVNITNHRTQKSDLDLMFEKVIEIGDELARSGEAS